MTMRPRHLTAVTRFGLGPSRGLVADVAQDPVGYVHAQCMARNAAMITGGDLLDLGTIRDRYLVDLKDLRQKRRAVRKSEGVEDAVEALDLIRVSRRKFTGDVMRAEIHARVRHGMMTDHPFVERLVLFWCNHFAVQKKRALATRMLVGNMEREAIRPHVLGYFEDLLFAAVTHPAMLIYLDNTRNIGPNSKVGRRRGAEKVNENLAREVLELHSLGAGSGYTQDDVVAFAHVLTGWTGGVLTIEHKGAFEQRFHDAGPRTILGKRYTMEGPEQLEAVLPDLARHPATARHIATKLAQHFVADAAPEALIEELTQAFLETDGDLRELALVLIESDHAWAGEPKKTVPPYQFMVSALRATDAKVPPPPFLNRSAVSLAHDIWEPPSPAGWSSDDGAFLGGDSLLERVDFATQVARRFSRERRAQDLAPALFGDTLDPFVAEAVRRAEDQQQAMVLLLMSPPFHRR